MQNASGVSPLGLLDYGGVRTLSQAGFFRFAAYNINDAESWHNYAACRQLVYGDFDGASECYLKAIQIDPKNAHIQVGVKFRGGTSIHVQPRRGGCGGVFGERT